MTIRKVALFIPCLVDLGMPETGLHMADLLEDAGFDVVCPYSQTCCGQPAFNTGYLKEAAVYAIHFLKLFDSVDCDAIVSPSGSCVSMIRNHYPDLDLDSGLAEPFTRVSTKLYEFTEFFASHADLNSLAFHREMSAVYHDPCHLLRELGVHRQPRTLLERVKGLELKPGDSHARCCGFGGTFAAKYPDLSVKMTEWRWKEFAGDPAPDCFITSDPSCLVQVRGFMMNNRIPTRCMHIVDFLHESRVYE